MQDFLKTSLEKFALGFAAGAVGAKALGKIANTKPAQNISAKTLQMLAKQARTNPRAKAVLEKMQVKSDIMPALEKGEQVKEADIIQALESSHKKGKKCKNLALTLQPTKTSQSHRFATGQKLS